ncbi:S1 RNA-binding domain-containing protein [Aureliella helgolandensis]|uniref:General stress protein 13 n=1 Tax=Aureliella helgolandensis TaxID=2527968 RepID=A0A518G7W7_9BACT|nr:Tex-like N-terminal domain-containing protein [Aureliella helgolandensis]QDV24673.1 General stress protein 13 [Aureliella helgolandensis]
MIDLSGIARHLRLSLDQIRIAGDLLQQGYQPAFIERYRADETGRLSRSTLWALKLEIDRQRRLQATRERLTGQLPKDSELDGEAKSSLERSTTEVEAEAALKAFRARRALASTQGRDGQAGELLEKMIAYTGAPIADVTAWVAQEFQLEPAAADQLLEQANRLISSLIQCDTELTEKLRRSIQKKANIRVELCANPSDDGPDEGAGDEGAGEDGEHSEGDSSAEATTADSTASETPAASDSVAAGEIASASEPNAIVEVTAAASEPVVASEPTEAVAAAKPAEQAPAGVAEAAASAEDAAQPESVSGAEVSAETPSDRPAESVAGAETQAESSPSGAESGEAVAESAATEGAATEASSEAPAEPVAVSDKDLVLSGKKKSAKLGKSKNKSGAKKEAKRKSVAKLTPRQRRRRWLMSMLNPMKSLRCPLGKLTAYQRLMLGRGRRSQLVTTELDYDKRSLVPMARDTFVAKDHPLVKWFDQTVEQVLDQTVRAKIEQEAIADLEEIAGEKLLVSAADQLRQTLMQRPVRGHTILVVDTVGPKAAGIAIVGPTGNVLATDEIACSAQPATVNQNVVKLGELVHKHRVTLVVLTNGPARRFLVLTLRELVKQSASSGLRWTMADRSAADAYAVGRVALRELSAYNRRDRAAIWVARSLQDPLSELLKVDVSRLRLGSYQRELAQEPLRNLVRDTISDCVCSRGIDTWHASVAELNCVPGVQDPQAQQIATLAAQGKIESRTQLLEAVQNWDELDSRQAIGMLRIYESEQRLDATLIHPDDYRLAERLIENTELELPPSAPEGWTKPAPMAAADVVAAEPSTSTEAASAPEAAASEESVSEAAAPETPTESGAAAGADDAQTATDAAAEVTVTVAIENEVTAADSGETPAGEDTSGAESVEADTAADSTSEGDASAESTEASAENSPTAAVATAPAEEAASTAGIKPEYSEDAVAEQAAATAIDVEKLARGWQVGREKLRSIAANLQSPFADPRLAEFPIPMMSEMPTLANLEPGMCVWAVVVGVAEFGAFVELGPDCSGLIHISRLSAEYVEDPHQCVQVGDLLMTWVVTVDEKKNRVALTALSPAQRATIEAANAQRREERNEQRRGPRGQSGGGGQGGSRAHSNRAPRQGSGSTGGGGRGRDGGGRGAGGGRGRGASAHPTKPVVVKSKKPKAPITDAMKDGAEPLRSFSDLLQFYETKRTDEPPVKTVPPPAPSEPTDEASNAEVES